MTVKELIEQLKGFPQDIEVCTFTGKHGEQPILEVSLEEGFVESEDVVIIEGSL